MPLRLIELTAPPGALDDLEDWPGERPIIDTVLAGLLLRAVL